MTTVAGVPDLESAYSGPTARVERHFRPDVQGMRAVAVLLVVLYHAHVPAIRGGYVGVDVFFVISGFLITRQLAAEVGRTGRISFSRFYARRARRLLPPAALVVVGTLLAARLWSPASQLSSLLKDAMFTAVYGVNYHLAAEGINYQQSSAPPSALQHFWSLAVEEQFYVLWPLLIALCAVLGRRGRKPLTVLVLVAVVAASLYESVTVTRQDAPLAYFALHTRAWELGLGALVALTSGVLLRIPALLAATLSWLGLGAILAATFWFTDATPYPGSAAVIPVCGAALLIAMGVREVRGSVERILRLRVAQGLGKVSYPLYLWHWPMLIVLPYAAGHRFSWPRNLEILGLALWLAVITHYLVEKPSMLSRAASRVWLSVGGALSASVVAVALLLATTLPTLVGTGAAQRQIALQSADLAPVQRALADGLATVAAPRNLMPKPADAVNDLPLTSTDGSTCHLDFLQTRQGPCVYGDPHGTRTAVLIGDSHAQQWLGALLPNAAARHWRLVVWTKSACPVADLTVYAPTLKRTYTECSSWRTAIVARIRTMHPDLLIASQSDLVVGTNVADATYATATVGTLQALGARRTVYLADTPTVTTDTAQCLEQHLKNVKPCDFAIQTAYQHPTREQVLARVLSTTHIQYIDTLQYFCTSYCPVVVGDIAVYRDAGHMTNTYAAYLAPALTPMFTSS